MTPDESRPDGDHPSSTDMQLAAAMLRRGDDLPTVADRTGVPVPLLERLRGEQNSQHRPDRRPRLPRGAGSAATLRMTVTVLIIEFAAFCSLTVCVIALLTHHRTLGVATGVIALGLITTVWLLIRRSRLPGPGLRR